MTTDQIRRRIAELRLQGVHGDGLTTPKVPGLLDDHADDDEGTTQLRRTLKAIEKAVSTFEDEKRAMATSGMYTPEGLEKALVTPTRKLRETLTDLQAKLINPRLDVARKALDEAPRPNAKLPELRDVDRLAIVEAYRNSTARERLAMESDEETAAALLATPRTLTGLSDQDRDRIVNKVARNQDNAAYERDHRAYQAAAARAAIAESVAKHVSTVLERYPDPNANKFPHLDGG